MDSVDWMNTQSQELFLAGNAACPGCALALTLRTVLRCLGKYTIMVNPAGCACVIPGTYPNTCLGIPNFSVPFAASAAFAAGIAAALKLRKIQANVLVAAGDGATYDIGLAGLMALAERDDELIYLCLNNEGYANTGMQSSGATPYGARTAVDWIGKPFHSKRLPRMLIQQGVSYVGTACAGYLLDLCGKIQNLSQIDGFRYLEVLCPCPTGWGFPASFTIKLARLAVETGYWILYEFRDSKFRFTGISAAIQAGAYQPRDLMEFLGMQSRFSGISQDQLRKLSSLVELEWSRLRALAEQYS